MEVARRLEEREREREKDREKDEEERRAREDHGSGSGRHKSRSPKKEHTLPSGVLTPLLKRHKDLDDELKTRLQELEKKLCAYLSFTWLLLETDPVSRLGSERGNKEVQLADVLSPVSKKKTGRAYVALARAHSEKYALSYIQSQLPS